MLLQQITKTFYTKHKRLYTINLEFCTKYLRFYTKLMVLLGSCIIKQIFLICAFLIVENIHVLFHHFLKLFFVKIS